MSRIRCPKCQGGWFWKLADGRIKCRSCGQKFSRRRSFWRGMKLGEKTKRKLLECFVFGVPAHRLRFRIRADLRSMEKFFRLIRQSIFDQTQTDIERFSGALEMDETIFGGHKRDGRPGWSAEGKQVVFGIYKRNGRVVVFPVPDREKLTLLQLIEDHTRFGSLYLTDEYKAYVILRYRGKHIEIHKEKGVATGKENINGIEGFWSYAKNWLYQYRGVPKKNFPLYLKEIEFRFNNRDRDLFPVLLNLMRKGGKS